MPGGLECGGMMLAGTNICKIRIKNKRNLNASWWPGLHLVSAEKQASVQSCASGAGGRVLGCGTCGNPNPVAVIRNKVTKQTDGLVASIFRVP
jgi:hypothetical protein